MNAEPGKPSASGPVRRARLGERDHRACDREFGVEACAQRRGRAGLFLGGSGYLLMQLVTDTRPLLVSDLEVRGEISRRMANVGESATNVRRVDGAGGTRRPSATRAIAGWRLRADCTVRQTVQHSWILIIIHVLSILLAVSACRIYCDGEASTAGLSGLGRSAGKNPGRPCPAIPVNTTSVDSGRRPLGGSIFSMMMT